MNDDCIISPNKRNKGGYACTSTFRFGKRVNKAHQLAWIDANGRLPKPGMVIMHSCDTPPCVNPDHLREGTQAENVADMVAKGRHRNGHEGQTHCKRGHELTEDNVYYTPGVSSRYCRACRRIRKAKSRAGLRAVAA